MKIVVAGDAQDLAGKAARVVLDLLRRRPEAVLTVATGETPRGMFRELVVAARGNPSLFSAVRWVMLDEYAGIAADDRRRLASWLSRELLDPLGGHAGRLTAFDPLAADAAAEGRRIEAAISSLGGMDLAVLGLGPNGHVGFNEPGSPFDSRTRLVSLAPESVSSNAAYWGSEACVPRRAFTLGLGTLMEARSLLLLVSGERKRTILRSVLNDPIGPQLPASVLRLHEDAVVITDRAALPET
jgi:glucosamine-6-phosphate deaminase